MRRPIVALLSAAMLAGSLTVGGMTTSAAQTIEAVFGPAGPEPGSGLARAERISAGAAVGVDVVTIYNRANALTQVVQDGATAAAAAAGAAWSLGRGATVGLRAVRRGASVVKAAPATFQYPMSVTALPINTVGPLMGSTVAAVLGNGQIVMSAKSAGLNNAQPGDVIDLVADDDSSISFTIGMVADDAVVGGAELVITPAMADQLGVVIETRIVLWGFSSRDAIDAALAAEGLTARLDTRIRRSWDPVDPDGTLGVASTKQLLGEFAYNVSASDVVTLSGDWVSAYLPPGREVLVPAIPIRARCNLRVRDDLIEALTEVSQAGLAGAIDVVNANTYGGCFYPRFTRLSAALGSLSRHSWAGALDTNTVTNAQGVTPQMNCDVVRIFRKHNFAWGGNFLTPDGMHFEWVGSRRDQYQYPSRFCPNLPATTGTERFPGDEPGLASEPSKPGQPGRDTLFAEDGWGGE